MMTRKKLIPAELARRAHMTPKDVSRIIKGHITDPRVSTAVKLADGMGCRVDDLLSC